MLDLADYSNSFLLEINAVGASNYAPGQDEITARLVDAFYEAKLCGVLPLLSYTCDENGYVFPFSSSEPDLARELVQVIILFAGYRALSTLMQNLSTSTTARAGSVEYSQTQSATVLQSALKAITSKIDIVLTRMSDLGSTSTEIIDAVISSTESMGEGGSWFIRGGSSYGANDWDGF